MSSGRKTNRNPRPSHICKRENRQWTYYCKERFYQLGEPYRCSWEVADEGKLYNKRNNVEILEIPSEVPDKDVEDTSVGICEDSYITTTTLNIEGCLC